MGSRLPQGWKSGWDFSQLLAAAPGKPHVKRAGLCLHPVGAAGGLVGCSALNPPPKEQTLARQLPEPESKRAVTSLQPPTGKLP